MPPKPFPMKIVLAIAITTLAWSSSFVFIRVGLKSYSPGDLASKVVLALYTIPLISTLLGWIILNEMPAMMELIGGCITLLGALAATRY